MIVVRLLVGLVLVGSSAFGEARIAIEVFDDPGFGFNDPTSVEPVGGNEGTTLGEQRLLAFQRAAEIWAEVIDSPVEIKILIFWEDTDAFLGLADTGSWAKGFRGAIRPNVWYPISLANKLAAVDLCPPTAPLEDCSVDWDMALLFGARLPFYLGLDGNSGALFDLVTVSLHEIAHGLGFSSKGSDEHRRADPRVFSANFYDSIYHVFLEGGSLEAGSYERTFPQMSRVERSWAVRSIRFLHWVGPRGIAAGERLELGQDVSGHGHLLMHAPARYALGESMLHLSSQVFPHNFMEIYLTRAVHDTTLAYSLLADMGWEATCPGDCNADGGVTVDELVRAVRMALGEESLVRCAILNTDNQGQVRVREVIRAVNSSLEGCAVEDSMEPLERPLVRVEQASPARNQALSSLDSQRTGAGERHLSGPAGGVVSPGSGVAYVLDPVVAADGERAGYCGLRGSVLVR